MNAAYTQVVQKRGGAAKSEIIDVANLNAKFDEIYERGGIYNFMSHPQWLDYGPDGFYERHLAHISQRRGCLVCADGSAVCLSHHLRARPKSAR